MRLTTRQAKIIAQLVSRYAGDTAEIYLFGSRLNDQAKGGDADILIEMDWRLSRIERGRIIMELGHDVRRFYPASPVTLFSGCTFP